MLMEVCKKWDVKCRHFYFSFFLTTILLFIIGIFEVGIVNAAMYSSPLLLLSVYYLKKYLVSENNATIHIILKYVLIFLLVLSIISVIIFWRGVVNEYIQSL
jgi:hypothetical protein